MKRILTFIYGLFYFGLALILEYKYDHETEWYRYVYLFFILCSAIMSIEKLDEATK